LANAGQAAKTVFGERRLTGPASELAILCSKDFMLNSKERFCCVMNVLLTAAGLQFVK
jgi:hypothetical protein